MVTTSAGCGADRCAGTQGRTARELVECAGEVGRGGEGLVLVLIEEMCDAGLPG